MLKRLGLASCLLYLPTVATAGVAELHWLSGNWCGSTDEVFNEEVWMSPRAGALVGMHRDSKDAKLLGFEYFRIVEQGDGLVYWSQPNGVPATAFKGTPGPGDSIEFVNAEHDFPKRVAYRRLDAQTLHARIDGGADQGPVVEWTWRLDCRKPDD